MALPAPPTSPLPNELPEGSRIIAVRDPLTRLEPIKEAIWAYDIMRYPVPSALLVVASDGPLRSEAERFSHALSPESKRLYVVPDAAWPELLARADQVWVCDPRRPDPVTVLQAQSRGVTVLASDLPGHRGLMGEGNVIARRDRVGWARRARELLTRPETTEVGTRPGVEEIAERLLGAVGLLHRMPLA